MKRSVLRRTVAGVLTMVTIAAVATPAQAEGSATAVATPLEAAQQTVEDLTGSEVVYTTTGDTATAREGAVSSERLTWRFNMADGSTQTADVATFFDDAATDPIARLLFVHRADNVRQGYVLQQDAAGMFRASGAGELACTGAVGVGGSVIAYVKGFTLIGTIAASIASTLIGAAACGPGGDSTLGGLTWYSGASTDLYDGYTGRYIDGFEDLVLRPYSCVKSNPGIITPCKGVTSSGTLGNITIRFTLTHYWPDGFIERTVPTCNQNICYLDYRYRTFRIDGPGTHTLTVRGEEAAPNSVAGPIPSGTARRAYIST